MRRIGVAAGTVFWLLTVAAQPAVAYAPSPTPSAPPASLAPGAGQPVCTVTDKGPFELSGLVAVDNGYLVINDSNPEASAKRIYRLDNQCKLASTSVQYPSNPIDPEDLGIAPDGTVWVADIGDNDANRRNVALWKLAPGGKTPVIHRITYPDGARDAEAILIGSDGTPIIVTKEVGRPAGVYVPSAALVPNNQAGVPLKRVGEIKLPASDTPNGLGPPGRLVVTGGATAPDGKRVALRTYADAFEWDVPDGDVVKAITTGKPRATPLPNEQQGEAITYSRDGRSFLTISDVTDKPAPLLRYTPAAAAPPAANKTAATKGATKPSGGTFRNLSLNQITYLVAAVGLFGVLLVLIGIVGIRRSRKARRQALLAARSASGTSRVAPVTEGVRVGGAPAGGPPEPTTSGGGVYRASSTGGSPGGPSGGGVYGARREPPSNWGEPEPYDGRR